MIDYKRSLQNGRMEDFDARDQKHGTIGLGDRKLTAGQRSRKEIKFFMPLPRNVIIRNILGSMVITRNIQLRLLLTSCIVST